MRSNEARSKAVELSWSKKAGDEAMASVRVDATESKLWCLLSAWWWWWCSPDIFDSLGMDR